VITKTAAALRERISAVRDTVGDLQRGQLVERELGQVAPRRRRGVDGRVRLQRGADPRPDEDQGGQDAGPRGTIAVSRVHGGRRKKPD
jgi:hypothetical protein